ncbi:IS6 family transposase, partial [Bacillus toyonensis]|uniref:DDE-type integrase/transposase/recombinase n=1 Tax=Bacillus toyonensis TaxID=155322 RepID=UPI000C016C66
IRELKQENSFPSSVLLRIKKYLNNMIEQDHRFIKKRIWNMLGLKSFRTAKKMIAGLEAMYMIKKKQSCLRDQSVHNQNIFLNQLFGLTV